MDKTETLLKEITTVAGIPGYEAEVRAVIRRHLASLAVIEQDKMGSIIHRDDYDNALKLIIAPVQKLDQKTVQAFTT